MVLCFQKGDINPNNNYPFKHHQMESLTLGESQNHNGEKEAIHIVGIRNTPKTHALNYTVIQIGGYELKAKKKREANGGDNPGRASLMSIEPHLSLIPQQESSVFTS